MRKMILAMLLVVGGTVVWSDAGDAVAGKKKVLLIAGAPSHAMGEHEYFAGCTLLAKYLNENVPGIEASVFQGTTRKRWPQAEDGPLVENADAIVVFANGEGGNPLLADKNNDVGKLAMRGGGIGCLHYAVESVPGPSTETLKSRIGGAYEVFWSVNPSWTPEFKEFPKHPVANGLKPFAMEDEWYFNMRFVDNMAGVTPILTAIPTDRARGADRKEPGNDAHRFNDNVKANIGKNVPEHLAWVYERPDGGRSFGVTGGHKQWDWANDNFRKMVLNAIVWIAKMEVPATGVETKTPTWEELIANMDLKKAKDRVALDASLAKEKDKVLKLIEKWNGGSLSAPAK